MTRALAGLAAAGLLALPAAAADLTPQTEAINKHIADGYKAAGIKNPSAKATELEFFRRVFIDLIGRIPTVDEVLDYEQDHGPNKRQRLVRRLLTESKYVPKVNAAPVKTADGKGTVTFDYANEYSKHWANIWTVWTMTRSAYPLYREQMATWLELRFDENISHKELVTRLLTASGQTSKDSKANPDANATNFIIHHLGEPNPADKQSEFGKFDAVPITGRVTRLFLGVQTQCVQCHDHPFNKEWGQGDFWGVNAFFRQTTRDKTPTSNADRRQMMANPVQVTLADEPGANAESIIFYERRDGKLMATRPNFLKDLAVALNNETQSKQMPKAGGKSRRQQLAEFVTGHDMFAKAYVNRIWGHLFGRGLNKEASIDDFSSNNEVVHPELLDRLATDFVKYNYDSKLLLEWICSSDAYGLSHVALKENADPKFDPYFARMPLKALSPEVLFESLMTATKAEAAADADARKKLRDDWMTKLVRNFGDDEGNEMTFNGTVVQALLMMNGRELNSEIGARQGANPVQQIVARHARSGTPSPRAVIDELFLATVNRHPTAGEMTKIMDLMTRGAVVAAEQPKAGDKPPATGDKKGTPPKRPNAPPPAAGPRVVAPTGALDVTFYQDVFWALLNTNEFMLNH